MKRISYGLWACLFLGIVGLFFSCSESQNQNESNRLKQIALQSQLSMGEVDSHLNQYLTRSAELSKNELGKVKVEEMQEYKCEEFEKALQKFEHEDIYSIFEQYNINPDVMDALEYYVENKESPNVYSDLEKRYASLSDKEFKLVFDSYYFADVIKEQMPLSYGRYDELTLGCAYSMAAMMVCVASAVTVTAATGGAGAALGYWLASYGMSVFGVIGSCGGFL